jgi:hypothetical protein
MTTVPPLSSDRSRRSPGKANAGNQRTGSARRMRPAPGRKAGPLAWRDDPLIRRRLEVVWRLMAAGHSLSSSLPIVAAWCAEMHVPSIGASQLKTDRKHIWELVDDEDKLARRDHIQTLQLIKREAFRAWGDRNESAVVRSRMLDTMLAVEDRLMRLTVATAPQPAADQISMFAWRVPDEVLASKEYRRAVSALLAVLPGSDGTGGDSRPGSITLSTLAMSTMRPGCR